ncbi:MAG TPA: MOSC N-terminal beta barrel domain-containing protein [Blastocatellia bacterium]|nr:MOSC N-terminal beta barrel domain-containing protein [Blastocatellia bacterium]
MSNEIVGTIAGLWRFPVKSMQGERLTAAELTAHGIVGDRAYALIDTDTGKVVSAKSVRLFPGILNCQAAFVAPPQAGQAPPPVRITLPDGTTVTSDDGEADRALSAFFGRNVTLAQSAPEDYTIDMYQPDIEGAVPPSQRDTIVEQKLGAALFAELGMDSPVPVGAFFDAFPLTVMTTSTLARLNELQPQTRFDERRFRMNVIVATTAEGFVENDWVGRALAFGDTSQLRVIVPDARCVMTTLAQDDLPQDAGVLRALAQHNRLQVSGLGRSPCAGVYAVIEAKGTIRTGDQVALS